jgi:hypothetical protein
MDVKFIIGAISCNDKEFKPPAGSNPKVGRCEECMTMVWVSPKALQLKREKPNHLIWCKECVEKEQQRPDTMVQFLDIDEDFNSEDFLFGDEFKEKLIEIEEKYFARAQSGHEQTMASLRDVLPSMISCAMGRLKIWDSLEDLTIALMLRSLVEQILLTQRETLGEELGPEATFHGYDRRQISILLKFLFGTSKALDDARRALKEKGEDAFYDQDTVDRWTDGFDHWAQGFEGNNWGDSGEDWNL